MGLDKINLQDFYPDTAIGWADDSEFQIWAALDFAQYRESVQILDFSGVSPLIIQILSVLGHLKHGHLWSASNYVIDNFKALRKHSNLGRLDLGWAREFDPDIHKLPLFTNATPWDVAKVISDIGLVNYGPDEIVLMNQLQIDSFAASFDRVFQPQFRRSHEPLLGYTGMTTDILDTEQDWLMYAIGLYIGLGVMDNIDRRVESGIPGLAGGLNLAVDLENLARANLDLRILSQFDAYDQLGLDPNSVDEITAVRIAKDELVGALAQEGVIIQEDTYQSERVTMGYVRLLHSLRENIDEPIGTSDYLSNIFAYIFGGAPAVLGLRQADILDTFEQFTHKITFGGQDAKMAEYLYEQFTPEARDMIEDIKNIIFHFIHEKPYQELASGSMSYLSRRQTDDDRVASVFRSQGKFLFHLPAEVQQGKIIRYVPKTHVLDGLEKKATVAMNYAIKSIHELKHSFPGWFYAVKEGIIK